MAHDHTEQASSRSGWQLHVVGLGANYIFPAPQGRTVIGRAATAGLALTGDRQVSLTHAELECSIDGCAIADRRSRNGTFHNGARLPADQFVSLVDGDELLIGQHRLYLRRAAQPEAAVVTPEPVHSELVTSSPPVQEPVQAHASLPPQTLPSIPVAPPHYGETPPGLTVESLRLLHYLPEIYRDAPQTFLSRFLGIFESILLPMEWEAENFDLYLSPATAPPVFLAWLASWYGITFHPSWCEARRRQVMAEAPVLFAQRGTKTMLLRLLEIYTGRQPEIEDGGDLPPYTFRVRVSAPPECLQAQGRLLIDAHKPVHTFYHLEWTVVMPEDAPHQPPSATL